MQTIKSELVRLSRPEELKSLLSSTGPCISIYFPVNQENLNPGDDERRWKQVLKEVEAQTVKLGAVGRELIEPLSDWGAVSEDRNGKEKTLVVFRSPDLFYRMWIRVGVGQRTAVAPQFVIRPLLPLLRDSTFYLLALSLNDVRLLRCTLSSSEQVALSGAETNFDKYMNSAKPDHALDKSSSAGPSAGSSKGILSSFSTDAEDRGEFLAHYFKQIDRALNATLKDKELVIPVAVEHELSLYRSLTTYPNLLTEGIHGAPNGLKGGEMHSRALDLLERHHLREVEKILGEYNHLAGGGKATNRLKEIVAAAHDGRVNKLVVSNSFEQPGNMDEATHEVSGARNGDDSAGYDLLNDAVVETILHAGQVFVAPNKIMPNGTPLVGIFRY